MKFGFIFLLVLFSLTSCVEIIDDISFKLDGSGTFKYTLNLSSSKVKINSILALDSLDGKKVPSIEEIKEKIAFYVDKLEEKEGVSNVKVESNYTDFMFKFSCDFKNVEQLQSAIKEIVEEELKGKDARDLSHIWLSWEPNKLTRSIPSLTTETTSKLKSEDAENLKKGSYVSITRFDRIVEKVENPKAVVSANKLAVMVKTNPFSLSQNTSLLDNVIYLTPLKIKAN